MYKPTRPEWPHCIFPTSLFATWGAVAPVLAMAGKACLGGSLRLIHRPARLRDRPGRQCQGLIEYLAPPVVGGTDALPIFEGQAEPSRSP